MTDIIRHQGIVENIEGSHLQVRIVQTSACAACSIKGHCSSADSKEKLIDVVDAAFARTCHPGEHVWVMGRLSMGYMAVCLAFVLPFLLLVTALFAFMALWHHELYAALCALALLMPYYFVLWLGRNRLKRKFSFSIQPMN